MTVFGINVPCIVWPLWLFLLAELVWGFSLGRSWYSTRRRDPVGYWLDVVILAVIATIVTAMFNSA